MLSLWLTGSDLTRKAAGMSWPEQIEKGPVGRNPHRSGSKAFLKRLLARLMRRLGKRLQDDAPTKPRYKGYEF